MQINAVSNRQIFPHYQIKFGTKYQTEQSNKHENKKEFSLQNFSTCSPQINQISNLKYSHEKLITILNHIKSSSSDLNDTFEASKETSIIDFLANQKSKNSPIEIVKFLYSRTQNPDTAKDLVREFISESDKTREKYATLKSLICTDKKGTQLFNSWLNDEISGYKSAYNMYYNEQWNNVQSLDELVKISPNIAPWALTNKAESLEIEVTIGKLPKAFGTLKDFRAVTEEIMNSNFYQTYKTAQDASCDSNTKAQIAQEHNINQNDSIEIQKIANKQLSESARKPIITKNGLQLEPILCSYSSKLIFKVTTPDHKVYYLKMDPYRPDPNDNTDRARKTRENADLRPDMPYLNAMIDFYLKFNNSKSSSDIEFYDYKTNSVLYKATEGKEAKNAIDNRIVWNLYLLKENKHVKELQKLGIQLNDIHNGNFLEKEDGNLVLIDSGHAYFDDPFKPKVIGKNIEIGNLCGRDCRTLE